MNKRDETEVRAWIKQEIVLTLMFLLRILGELPVSDDWAKKQEEYEKFWERS